MALSDREIWNALGKGDLVVDPTPDITAVNAASIDLHLHRLIQVYKSPPEGIVIDLRNAVATAQVAYHTDTIDLEKTDYFLTRDSFVIAYTEETIGLPNHLMARVEGRSSYARIGISVHNEAPTIQPGWTGQIALELTNVGPLVLQLRAGLIICQLVLEHLGRPTSKPYAEQFQGQKAPETSR